MAEKNVKSVHILGDTPKIQWNNAINIYRMAIQSNLIQLENSKNREIVERLECITGNVLDELQRLVDEMFSEEVKEESGMNYESCKDCAYCEYHNEVVEGVEYNGYYCGRFDYLTDEAKLENIKECEWAE